MSGDENNEEEIVTEGQEEKGGIQDAKDDKSESTDMKENAKRGRKRACILNCAAASVCAARLLFAGTAP